MSDTSRARSQAAIVAIAPAVLVASLVTHPFIPGRLPDSAAIAQAVAADTTRWGVVHLATGVASALLVLAFLAIRVYLREVAGDRHSAVGVPFIVVGSTLFAMLPAMEFAPLAAAETGADLAGIASTQAALEGWFLPLLVLGGATFAIGVVAFIRGIIAADTLSAPLTAVVTVGLVAMAASRFVPLAAVQFYLQSAAALLAFWPLAGHLWAHAGQHRPIAGQTSPAT